MAGDPQTTKRPTHRLLAQTVRLIARHEDECTVQFSDGSISRSSIPATELVSLAAIEADQAPDPLLPRDAGRAAIAELRDAALRLCLHAERCDEPCDACWQAAEVAGGTE